MSDVIITKDILAQAHFTEAEFLLEVAVHLYVSERLSLGLACKLAQLDVIAFQKELAKRKIGIHYSVQELHDDLRTLGLSVK
jgi:predicted HTH domain antitoxin